MIKATQKETREPFPQALGARDIKIDERKRERERERERERLVALTSVDQRSRSH